MRWADVHLGHHKEHCNKHRERSGQQQVHRNTKQVSTISIHYVPGTLRANATPRCSLHMPTMPAQDTIEACISRKECACCACCGRESNPQPVTSAER